MRVDTIVVGAGAAGLAATAELAGNGRSVCVLEARDRLGGRILTRREPDLAVPLELGAEFVHGRPAATLAWLASSEIARMGAQRTRWTLRDGKLQPAQNLLEDLQRSLARLARPRQDLAFGDFLDGLSDAELSAGARDVARRFAEGFDAADTSRLSTLDTLDTWCADAATDGATFRPLGGYATLIAAITRGFDPEKVRLRLNALVRDVHWRAGSATVSGMQGGQPFSVEAQRVIVTVPLAVLDLAPDERGGVRFVPDISAKRAALSGLATGAALKVVLRFRESFWEALDGDRYRDAGFFHAPGAPFPTFWSALPLRAPVLCAWVGGPNAARLAAEDDETIIGLAVESLEAIFGRRVDAQGLLAGTDFHNWQTDPFARGAYSYVAVGGTDARRLLAAPVGRTLFFAGEASDTQGEAATVAGALQSGLRAAREALAGR